MPLKVAAGVVVGITFVVGLISATPTGAFGALGTSITVSPSLAAPGRLVEVRVRTQVTVPGPALDLEIPPRYPAPSGLLHVLDAVPEYPFRVTATGPDGSRMAVTPGPVRRALGSPSALTSQRQPSV